LLYQHCRVEIYPTNHSQSQENPRQEMTQDFLPRFTCFPASYSSLWRYTHLMDHELIGNPKPNPQRVPHIHSQDEDPPSHEQSTRVTNLRSPAGKAQEPLTNHLVRLETISNHELNTTAAPSRLGRRETPKSNKNSAANSRIKCH